jgi:hypothetical protein
LGGGEEASSFDSEPFGKNYSPAPNLKEKKTTLDPGGSRVV